MTYGNRIVGAPHVLDAVRILTTSCGFRHSDCCSVRQHLRQNQIWMAVLTSMTELRKTPSNYSVRQFKFAVFVLLDLAVLIQVRHRIGDGLVIHCGKFIQQVGEEAV